MVPSDLMAVVIVGTIDPNLAEEKVKAYFDSIQKHTIPEPGSNIMFPDNDEPLISVATEQGSFGYNATIFYNILNQIM